MKIGFVGAGRIVQSHFDAFHAAGANVTAVCTRGEGGRKFAQNNQINYYSNLEALIKSETPDAVCLLTQPNSYPHLLEIIKSKNLPVFLEKPISYSYKEGLELKKQLPKKVMVGQNRRFYSNIQKIIPVLTSETPVSAHFFINERAKDIQVRDECDRNTWHVMNGIHGVDLMKFMYGSPKRILFKDNWGHLSFSKLHQYNCAIFESEKGHTVYFHSNFDSPGGWRTQFYFKETEVTVFPIEKTTIKTISEGLKDVDLAQEDSNFKQGFFAQAKCFLQGLHSSDLPESWVHYEDALDSIKLTEELYGTL